MAWAVLLAVLMQSSDAKADLVGSHRKEARRAERERVATLVAEPAVYVEPGTLEQVRRVAGGAVQREEGSGTPPCGLVDVGLNDGRSLLQWPHEALRELQARGREPVNRTLHSTPNAFHWISRFKAHVRTALERQDERRVGRVLSRLRQCMAHSSQSSPSDQACYYGFEANPSFHSRLTELEESLHRQGACASLHLDTAFADRTSVSNFYVSSQASTKSSLDKSQRGTSTGAKSTVISTEDAGLFLRNVTRSHSFVAAKVDIEGSEFDVLRHLILHHAATLCSVDLLLVEWHRMPVTARQPARTHIDLESLLPWLLAVEDCRTVVLPWV